MISRKLMSPWEVGFDKVCNFTHYFPHNNISNMIPDSQAEVRSAVFDYGVETYAENTKNLLRKFVNILKDKVKAKRAAEYQL
mmetsp:Transcript_12944/g.11074  ORF Transcript_12944/g.11074 Transcript_12944/m.11074 type:complete len:82 (-) Transcript_12944:692-937(-)